MTVKDLITNLLDMDMRKEISIEYPNNKGLIVGNYSRYEESGQFSVAEYGHGVIIGVADEN